MYLCILINNILMPVNNISINNIFIPVNNIKYRKSMGNIGFIQTVGV